MMKRYANKKLNPDFYGTITFDRKCECGGETANTTHSDWCPK